MALRTLYKYTGGAVINGANAAVNAAGEKIGNVIGGMGGGNLGDAEGPPNPPPPRDTRPPINVKEVPESDRYYKDGVRTLEDMDPSVAERRLAKTKELNQELYAKETPDEKKKVLRKELKQHLTQGYDPVVLAFVTRVVIPMASLLTPFRQLLDLELGCNAMVIAATMGHPSDALITNGKPWVVFRKVYGVTRGGYKVVVSPMNLLTGLIEEGGLDAYRRIAPILGLLMVDKVNSIYHGRSVLKRGPNGVYSIDVTELRAFKRKYLKPFQAKAKDDDPFKETRERIAQKLGKLFASLAAELAQNPKGTSVLLDELKQIGLQFTIEGSADSEGKKKDGSGDLEVEDYYGDDFI